MLTTWLQAPSLPEKSCMPMMAKTMNSNSPNMATEAIGGMDLINASTTICMPCSISKLLLYRSEVWGAQSMTETPSS